MAMVQTALQSDFLVCMHYWFGYNIEELAAAQCIGYVAAGAANIVIFMNADWDRAVRKAEQTR